MKTTLALYVANGVTTVRGMLGYPNHLIVRKEIEAGELWGPSLFLAGPGLSGETVKSPVQSESVNIFTSLWEP